MENYNIVKQKVNNRLLFKMSQIGYALHCDLLFTLWYLFLNTDIYMEKISVFKNKYPNALTYLDSIQELLLQT